MRIIENVEETTLPTEEPSEVKEVKEKSNDSLQKQIFNISQQMHELGVKLANLATKL